MTVEQPILVTGSNVSRDTETQLSMVYIAEDVNNTGLGNLLTQTGDGVYSVLEIPKVEGAIAAIMDPDTPQLATLYVLRFEYPGFASSPTYTWWPVDLNWPKKDPNTGQDFDTNLLSTDPDYVQIY